jgi:hypothetical protein
MINFIVRQYFLAFKHGFVESVFLILLDVDSHLGESVVEELIFAVGCVASGVLVTEGDFAQLLDVLNVINRKAFFEFFRELFNVLFVTNREDDSGDVVVFACR